MSTQTARALADAVMYEGYVLYPYTASARKNRSRWQFGVLVPPSFAVRNGEPSRVRVDLPARRAGAPQVELTLRFLHVQRRLVFARANGDFTPVERLTVDYRDYVTWDEAMPQEVALRLDAGADHGETPIAFPAGRDVEDVVDATGAVQGRIVRERLALNGSLIVEAQPAGGDVVYRVSIENASTSEAQQREEALRSSFIATHVLASIRGGAFVSLQDPPEDAAEVVGACARSSFWPVLLDDGEPRGRTSTLALVAPIILSDHPELAAETAGDTFDGTEIDELLNLSVMTLTDDEKREARATDERTRAIVDRAESLSAEHYGKLHGAIRYLRQTPAPEPAPGSGNVVVDGVRIQTGSRVVLHPKRRADVWDTFLEAKAATVRGVYEDAEGEMYVAVTVDDDPASDMHEWYGRSLFFYPDEVEPAEVRR